MDTTFCCACAIATPFVAAFAAHSAAVIFNMRSFGSEMKSFARSRMFGRKYGCDAVFFYNVTQGKELIYQKKQFFRTASKI
ncbi:hypothetical protein ACG74X_19205 [Marivita sp. S0852]|uniref:hypothetical protein n=1 Tax=Marivita sp. S0852 TaxID=3373893 RepID=UPI003981E98E